MTHEKQKCINEIKRAIEHAREQGYTVVVASDPEGNNWNRIETMNMIYGDTSENYIAIGVHETIDEDEIFTINE